MRQTCESERENGGNNDAECERTSESEIEDLGAQPAVPQQHTF